MFKNERQHEIMKILTSDGYATVEGLSKLLYASESSIRRDLIELENENLVTRSYGGVELAKNNSRQVSFNSRLHRRVQEKKRIAEKAAELVSEKDIVFLDQSSSALFLAQELVKSKKITIVTNNIEILSYELPAGITVYSSGGRVSSYRRCLIGEDANAIFNRVRADFAVISSKAVSADSVIYDNTLEEVLVKEAMMKNASKKVFLCDSEKFDSFSGYRQCPISDLDYMVSEIDCTEKYQKYAPNLKIL